MISIERCRFTHRSLTRHHPETQTPADRLPTDQSCTNLVASVPQILFANLAVASALLNTLWLHLCGALHYSELSFDIADGLMRPVLPIVERSPQGPGPAPTGKHPDLLVPPPSLAPSP